MILLLNFYYSADIWVFMLCRFKRVCYSFFSQHMNIFHDLLKEYNMTLVTSALVSGKESDIKVLISRLKVGNTEGR